MTAFPVFVLLSLASLPDLGIFPEYADQVRISAPSWLTEGKPWLRLDNTHRVLTLYRDDVPLVAYALSGEAAGEGLAQVLPLLQEGDRADLKRTVPADVPVRRGVPTREEDHDGDGIVDSLDILLGAKKLCLNKAAYREEYRAMKYPGGDVPRTEGVCTDTIIRALRNAGWDLQKEVHEDLLRAPRVYPLEKKPDTNIDHRRVRNVVPWFVRHFELVKKDAPLHPGDIVFLDTFPQKAGPDHIGIISDRLGRSGLPVVINNWTNGFVEQEMELLPMVPVTHIFRARMR